MSEEELRMLKIQMIDLSNRVKNITTPIKLWVLFFVLLIAIISSHIILRNHITSSSIKNYYAIKKQMKEYNNVHNPFGY